MKTLNILRFDKGFNVAINRTAGNKETYYFVSCFGSEIKGGKYNKSECKKGYGYGTSAALNLKIEESGRYNVHYWKTIKQLIADITQISGLKLIAKSYLVNGYTKEVNL
jgi:hypothetical protein